MVSWVMVFALVYGQQDQLDFTTPGHLNEKLHIQETLNMNLTSEDRVGLLDFKGYVAYLSYNIDMKLLQLHNNYVWVKHFTKFDIRENPTSTVIMFTKRSLGTYCFFLVIKFFPLCVEYHPDPR